MNIRDCFQKTAFFLFLPAHCLLAGTVGKEHPTGLFSQSSVDPIFAWRRYAVEGFAWPASVRPGETIKFYVSTMAINGDSTYDLQIFRVPNVDVTAETSFYNITGKFYPLRDVQNNPIYPGDYSRKPVDFKKGCKDYWAPTAVSFTIPAGWGGGMYAARLTHHQQNVYDS